MKTLSKKTLLVMLLFIFCGISFKVNAQENYITGLVTSTQGEPLIGVSIMVENTKSGTVTDFDGNFSIDAQPEDKLTFTYIGYKSQTVKAGNQKFLNIKMEEDAEELEELVVIGYGAVKKSDLTGAVTSIKASDLQNTAAAGIEVALQGKIPGVFINKKSGKPGETADIKIRGIGSFNGAGPLWIIDGVAQNPGVEFNMNDAESVEILRDGSAAAIYGAAAANGVVIVTTKRGKSGDARLNLNAYVGFNKPTNLPNMLSTRQLKELRLEDWNGKGLMTQEQMLAFPLDYSLATGKDIRAYALDFDYTNADYNWKDIIFSTGITQNYDLSFTKGSDDYNYYASFNYYDEKGTYMETNFKRYSFRLNSDVKINKWLSFGESFQMTYTDNKPNANNNFLNNYMRTLPFMMPYDENNQPGGFGYFPTKDAEGNDLLFPDLNDPSKSVDIKYMLDKYDGSNLLADEETTDIRKTVFNLNGNAFVKIQPIKQFSIKGTFAGGIGMGSDRTERGRFWYHEGKEWLSPSVTQNLNRSYGLTGQLVANYNDIFNDVHSLAVMAGMEASKSRGVGVNGHASNMLGDIYQISLADPEYQLISDTYSNSASLSYFGRVNYDYDDKYFLMALVRRDGYDRFGPDNRWGTFPSFSGAWKISNENFIRNNANFNWLTSLKLRASWGVLGNSGIPQFKYTSSYINAYSNYAWGPTDGSGDQKSVTGSRLNQLPNHKIKWEEITTTDVGLDIGVLNNKLLFSFDWYIKNTTDALFNSSLPGMVGMGKHAWENIPYTLNVGKIRNTGCDFELTYRNKAGKDFNYSINANLGFFKNEVLATNEDNEILISGAVTGGHVSYTQKGYPMGTFFAYETIGVFQTEEQVEVYNRTARENGHDYYQESGTGPGDLIFRDVNGDGHIDSKDITDVGNPWPDFTYGLTFNCNYKWLDFSIFFQGVQGNEIYNDFRIKTHTFTLDYNSTEYALNRWTGPGSTNENFRLSSEDPNKNERRASSWFVEDGSYLRMKNIQLGVTLPKQWTTKALISNCRFYVSGQNLLTFTKYEGFDPEFSTGSNTAYGIDTGYYPQSKSIICGVQIDF